MATKCPKCHLDNTADSKFCGECGTQLIPSKGSDISKTLTIQTPAEELTRGALFAGRYEIIEELGTGGMGSVYRAYDKKIEEEVALKLIRPDIAAERKTVDRFRNEIKVARKIRHANVCGTHDLHEEGKTLFITMEYVRGEDLKSLMKRTKVLAAGTAVSIVRQVAEGLGEAHRLGVVHRDLKPSNIMIDKEGNAKIMDFGIARSLAGAGTTAEGSIIGTPEYMSPEQVEGKPADERADIYSLGVILFEMVTGRAPFEADTSLAVAHKHRYEPAPDPRMLNPQIPQDLSRLILHCLEKERETRYQTTGELLTELEAVEASLPKSERAPTGRPSTKLKAISSKKITVEITPNKLIIPVIALIAIIVIIIVWITRGTTIPLEVKKAAISLEEMQISRLTSTGKALIAAISPDGKYVVHVKREGEQQSLWIRQTATMSDVQIVPPANVRYDGVAISPDATYVYYSAYEGPQVYSALYQLPVLGGSPRKILEDIDSAVSFSPDGSEIVFVRGILDPPGAQLVVAKVDGTNQHALATSQASGDMFINERPSWSPDNSRLAVAYIAINSGGAFGIGMVDVKSGEFSSLGTPSWSSIGELAWLADGSAVIADAAEQGAVNQQIWRIDYPEGHAKPLTNDLASYKGVSLSADSRTLVTSRTETKVNLWVMPAGSSEAARPITSGPGRLDGTPGIAWTSDGRIVYCSTASGNPDIWIANQDGSGPQQLTFNLASDVMPAVCDDQFIVFTSSRTGSPQIWRMTIDGSGLEQLSNRAIGFLPVCAPNSRKVVYTSKTDSGQNSIWMVPIEGGESVLLREIQSTAAAISPDGRMVAGGYVDGQRQSIAIMSLDSNDPPLVLPIFPRWFAWSPDGKALTYVEKRSGADNLWRQPLPSGPPSQLTAFTSDTIYKFAWSPDGRQIALSRGNTYTDIVLFSAKETK